MKRSRPRSLGVRPLRKRPPQPRIPDPVTVLDLVRYAVTRFTAEKLVFAHGTTDPVA